MNLGPHKWRNMSLGPSWGPSWHMIDSEIAYRAERLISNETKKTPDDP